ncbi:Hypothetical protein OINT_1000174 [Brucella intermedia LMG 3301]|uniref:Uncharacterized protein n=1 Tax=Brucella intermedia LMG 3301 TaxID=641118 RepID=C4WGX5_9HYPH|nr:Hypothetical protein OINT_1000174 [Brucella intermedia LMG 3301]
MTCLGTPHCPSFKHMHNRNFFQKLRIPGHFPQKHMLETSISCFLPKTGQSGRHASILL